MKCCKGIKGFKVVMKCTGYLLVAMVQRAYFRKIRIFILSTTV